MAQPHSFNTYRQRMAAGRKARRNPLKIPFLGGSEDNRRNTISDVESARGGGRGGLDGSPLQHATTAPESRDREGRLSEDGSRELPAPAQNGTSGFAVAHATTDSEMMRRNNTSTDKTPEMTKGAETESKKRAPLTVGQQLKTIFASWINILLVAIPAGFAVNYAGVDGRIVFAVNFIAIVPLAGLLGLATEEIALEFNETIGGLINATFGNAVELIVAIIALLKNEVKVVQTSLVGSILSNLLLVLGMCFFFGGWSRKVQHFNKTVAQTAASLLALAVASNIVPTVFATQVANDSTQTDAQDKVNVAALSRGTSVILLVVYFAYLYFQLGTHSRVFAERSQKAELRDGKEEKDDVIGKLIKSSGGLGAVAANARDANNQPVLQHDRPSSSDTLGGEEEEEEEPQLTIYFAFGLLLIATVLIAFCAEFMVDGIQVITESGVSVEFVGLILLPIVGNAAEHYTAVTVAIKDKMDLAIGVAVGSSMQVSLFLIPFLVIVGWGKGNDDMNLAFDNFQTAVMFVAVLLVNYLIADGESHWLEGALLMSLYLIIAVCSWWYPSS